MEIVVWANENSGFIGLLSLALPVAWAVGKYGWIIILKAVLVPWGWAAHLISRITQNRNNKTLNFISYSNAFDYFPLELAKKKGFLKRRLESFRIKYEVIDSYEEIKQKILNKEVDVIFLAMAPAIRLFSEGYKLSVFDALCLHTQYLISCAGDVRRLRDMLMKRVGVSVPEYSSSHYGLLRLNELSRLQNTVSPEFMGIDEGRESFRNKSIDVWGIWPLHSEAELERSGTTKVNGSEVSIYSLACIVGDDEKKCRRIIEAVSEALRESKAWINSNKKTAKNFAKINFRASDAILDKSWDGFDFMVRYDEVTRADLSDAIKLMRDNGWFEESDFDRFFYKI